MSKKNEVAVTTETGLTTYSEADMASWGGNELSSKDIVIPAVLLLQSNSDFAKEGKGTGGDFYNAVTGENYGKKLENIVPFHMEKTWTVEKLEGTKWKWDHSEKMTPENESDPYEFSVGNDSYRRKYTYRFFFLINGEVLPATIKMKGASKKAGANLSTEMFVKNAMKRLPPAALQFTLSSKLEKNDEGDSYFVILVTPTTATPYEKVMEALNWFKTIRDDKSTVVVAEDKDF
jgi:hypothetical protein